MGVLDEYMEIRGRIVNAVNDTALPYIALGLGDYIEMAAQSEVYSYPASQWALSQRRYGIGDRSNMVVTIGQMAVKIENETTMQSGEGGEVDEVEQGWGGKYRQPGPRPFMEPALEAYVSSGQAEQELAGALRTAGFEVN